MYSSSVSWCLHTCRPGRHRIRTCTPDHQGASPCFTVGRISPLLSSSQKAVLPHKTAERSFHQTITHSATGPASNPCVGAQTPIAHSQFVAVREASLLQPSPQSCCLQSFADGSCCKVDALLLHRRPKIRGGQPTVGQARLHQYVVFSHRCDLRAFTSGLVSHRASLTHSPAYICLRCQKS